MSNHHEATQGSVLHVTITHLIYPVTEKVLGQLFDSYGVNDVCMLQQSTHLEAFVEFQSWHEASKARSALHGRCIYDDCCLLDIQHAPSSISVHRLPNSESIVVDWDQVKVAPPAAASATSDSASSTPLTVHSGGTKESTTLVPDDASSVPSSPPVSPCLPNELVHHLDLCSPPRTPAPPCPPDPFSGNQGILLDAHHVCDNTPPWSRNAFSPGRSATLGYHLLLENTQIWRQIALSAGKRETRGAQPVVMSARSVCDNIQPWSRSGFSPWRGNALRNGSNKHHHTVNVLHSAATSSYQVLLNGLLLLMRYGSWSCIQCNAGKIIKAVTHDHFNMWKQLTCCWEYSGNIYVLAYWCSVEVQATYPSAHTVLVDFSLVARSTAATALTGLFQCVNLQNQIGQWDSLFQEGMVHRNKLKAGSGCYFHMQSRSFGFNIPQICNVSTLDGLPWDPGGVHISKIHAIAWGQAIFCGGGSVTPDAPSGPNWSYGLLYVGLAQLIKHWSGEDKEIQEVSVREGNRIRTRLVFFFLGSLPPPRIRTSASSPAAYLDSLLLPV